MTNAWGKMVGLLGAVVGTTALVLQLILTIGITRSQGGSLLDALATYLSFFTILTNLLVALALALPLMAPESALGQFVQRPVVLTGIAVNIVLVGIAYSLLLRHLESLTGLDLLANRLLHDVMPILFSAYWWMVIRRDAVRFSDIPRWLIYPGVYLAYALTRGALTGTYPYPFINAATIGYERVAVNALAIMMATIVLSVVAVTVCRSKPDAVRSR